MTDTYKETIYEKQFNSVQEVICDERFNGFLQNIIDNLKKPREPPKNLRFKRNAIDFLKENNLLFPEQIIIEFSLIVEKKSELSSNVRDAVIQIMNQAVQQTVVSYTKVVEKSSI